MAKINTTPKDRTPTTLDHKSDRKDWKRDRYEQRNLKTSARRSITGGF